jgi:hypothetical protein
MRRREVVALFGGAALATPLAARAQQQANPARIGRLMIGENTKSAIHLTAFSEKMRELGYVEGQTLVTEFRSAGGDVNRLDDLAMELVRLLVRPAAKKLLHQPDHLAGGDLPGPVSAFFFSSMERAEPRIAQPWRRRAVRQGQDGNDAHQGGGRHIPGGGDGIAGRADQ